MDPTSFDVSHLREKNYYSLLRDLVKYIDSRHYKVGDRLPQEAILAQELNTNRSTLREMLRVLEVLGVIDSQRGSGNVYLGNLEVGFMNLFLISSMMSDGKPQEFSSIRAAIEAEAVELFIDKATDADVYKLEILYTDHMGPEVDKLAPDYLDSHIRFHDTILKYSPNETAKQLIRSNLRLMKRDYETAIDSDPSVEPTEKARLREQMEINSHKMIVSAIKERDKAKARKLIINHAFMTGIHKNFL